MADQVMTKAKGLYTFANFLSAIPEGSLLDATNTIIDRDGVIEPRRGIHHYGEIGTDDDRVKQLLNYKGRILAHYDDIIAYDNGSGTFTDFITTFPEVQTGLRIKGVELNGNFYVTTDSGIKKISAATNDLSIATVSDAGGVKALDGSGIVDYSSAGFFLGNSKVAYRIIWGIKDVNNNLIYGSPSSRIVLTNYATESATTQLTFSVPDAINSTNYFYQIYRTSMTTATDSVPLDQIDPGDEMRLVYEANVTSGDISSGEITIQDITPEDFQLGGAPLYTNPTSGDGILQANEPPPVAKDIALFKNSIFYANTRTKHKLDLSLLGIANLTTGNITNISDTNPAIITSNNHGLSNGDRIVIAGTGSGTVDAEHVISGVTTNTFTIPVNGTGASDTAGSWFSSYITVTNGTTTNRYFFVGRAEVNTVVFDTKANTTDGGYFNISSANDLVRYFVWFDKTGTTNAPLVLGQVGIRVDISNVGTPEITTIGFDTKANTVDTSWFRLWAGNNTTGYYVWFDKTGSSIDPAPGGLIGIRVDISGLSGTNNVSSTVKSAIETSTSDFSIIQSSTNILAITTVANGATTNSTVGTTAPGGAFAITITQDGSSSVNVAPTVKEAIENSTADFVMTESPSGTLIIINANNGIATDASVGSVSPGGAFAISTTQQGLGQDLTKNYIQLSGYVSAAQAVDDTARSMVLVINHNNSEIIDGFYLSGPDDIPGIMNYESRELNDISFSITANNASVGALFNPDITSSATSTNEVSPNRLYFSKYQQPEAVPIVNYLDIGPKDKDIVRILALRDSLFIFKQDGIYRLTGEISPNFQVTLFDNSVRLIAPDTASILNNQIYCLTDGGIATVTETGVGIVSRPIENVFNHVTTENYPNFSTASFGMGYETERCYLIWTVTNKDDTFATQCFRYNTFTQAWTRWDKPQTAVTLNSADNKLYAGSTDTNFVEVERKELTRKDYADRDYNLSIPNSALKNSTTLSISSVSDAGEGDAIIQTQYVTIDQFNMILIKLDADPRIGMVSGTFDTDYAATLTMAKGDNLSNKMSDLITKLNADPGTDHGYTFTGSSDFATIQTEFNTMIDDMNNDSKLKFNNYSHSSGTSEFELTIETRNINTNTITTDFIPKFMVGPVVLFKGIQTQIIWAPLFMGDPSMLKHIRESTILFEASDFRGAELAFNTDLSPSFEPMDFEMDGNGTWGGFFWGENNWGGSGSSVPFRTYIPRQKQRCRYIRSRFKHGDAFYKYSILGISFVYENSSNRAYRNKN